MKKISKHRAIFLNSAFSIFLGLIVTFNTLFIVKTQKIKWEHSPYQYDEIRSLRGFPFPFLIQSDIKIGVNGIWFNFIFDWLIWAIFFVALKQIIYLKKQKILPKD